MSVEDDGYVVKYLEIDPNIVNNHLEPDDEKIKNMEKSLKFYSKLEESILKDGFRNPVLIMALRENDIRIRYGGSRLMVAQKHDLKIPAIVTDYKNIFPDAEVLYTISDIRSKFKDQPKKLFFQPQGLWISGCEHTHLRPAMSEMQKRKNQMAQSLRVVYLRK